MTPHDITDRQVAVELAWCPECQVDCFVEIVQLTSDPGPVALCTECGLGVDLRWLPELGDPERSTPAGTPVARAS